jgi:aldehyde dehydrogenase (NAD+)
VNSTNLFDAAAGFGGYRESGFGREGGREGMWEYVKAKAIGVRRQAIGKAKGARSAPDAYHLAPNALPAIDRTPKLFIAGKQARPDGAYTARISSPSGVAVGEAPLGNRKDIRNAVEAAHAAKGWGRATGHNRAQILYYIAENLAAREAEFAARLDAMTGCGTRAAREEVGASIARLFTYGAWADKYDGAVHSVPIRGVAIAMNEPIGVIGIACADRYPLLGMVSLVAPAIAMGNAVIVIPSQPHPLAATDFYGVLETSDVPAGVVNIVTGERDSLAKILAEHDDVEAMWYFGTREGAKAVELASAANMKRTWAEWDERDWLDRDAGEGRAFLRAATHVKNIWVPYGE